MWQYGGMKKIKLAILDGYATNPGDLSWAELEELAEVTVWDRSAPGREVAERVADADAVMLNKAKLDGAAIRGAVRLRYAGILATGYNTIDLAAAREKGMAVANVPGYSTMSVAQQAWALLLELTNGAGAHAADVRRGGWSANPDYCYWLTPQVELAGLTLGVVGFGAIGRAVAGMGRAFGMRVLANRRTAGTESGMDGVEMASLDRVLAESDVVSLHCPLTEETAGLIDAERLAKMKRGALLINTARGGLLDEAAVVAALESGQLGGAGLDVVSEEPPPEGLAILKAKNCVVSPHLAWATAAARKRLIHEAAENLRAWMWGERRNRVD